jgi:hypothetical protein
MHILGCSHCFSSMKCVVCVFKPITPYKSSTVINFYEFMVDAHCMKSVCATICCLLACKCCCQHT